MNHRTLTDRTIRSLPIAASRYIEWDASTPAFGVRVGTTGKKTFVGMFRLDGKSRMITYGTFGTGIGKIGLARARVLHAQAMEKVERKEDPGTAKVAQNVARREAPTVSTLAGEYLEHHARKKKKESSADQDRCAAGMGQTPG